MRKIYTVLLIASFSLMAIGLYAQNNTPARLTEKAVLAWHDEQHALQQEYHLTDQDYGIFSTIHKSTLDSDKMAFIKLVLKGTVNSTNINAYISNLNKKYTPLFNQFASIKLNNPPAFDSYNNIQNHKNPNSVCTTLNNIDFSAGNLWGWDAYYGQNNSTATAFIISTPPTGGPCAAVTGAANDPTTNYAGTGNDYQVSIINPGYGSDPLTNLPTVFPTSSYSVRIGDSTNFYQGFAFFNRTFLVTPLSFSFTYNFAAVLEHPIDHTYTEQPFFSVTFLDQNGDTIPCSSIFISSSASGFKDFNMDSVYYTPDSDYVYYTQWKTRTIFLNKYIGQCVTVMFKTADCSLGSHFGYAYIDTKATSANIVPSSPFICGNPITLTAPPGITSYQWLGPAGGITSGSTSQTITISSAGTYSLVINPGSCPDTLSINVPTGSLSTNLIMDTVYCSAGLDTITENITSGTAPFTYQWSGGQTSSAISGLSAGGPYSVTVTDANGCKGADTFSVYQNSYMPVAKATPSHILAGDSSLLTAQVNGSGYTLSWAPSGDTNTSWYVHPAATTTYTLSVNTSCGTYTDTVTVHVSNCTNTFNQQICIVTTDTATNKNVIIWGRNNAPPDGSFNIYDSAASGWSLLATVADTSLSQYIDSASNPESRSYSYKISTLDSCGESALSATNSSIYLQVFQNGGTNSLTWTPYVGFATQIYKIYRGPSLNSLTLIDSVSGSLSSYTDNGAPAGSVYLVEAINPSGACKPTKKFTQAHGAILNTQASFSNGGVPVIITGINTLPNTSLFTVYPVPASNKLTIQLASSYKPTANSAILVYDITGRLVMTENINTQQNTKVLDISQLDNGVYILILTDHNLSRQTRFIIAR